MRRYFLLLPLIFVLACKHHTESKYPGYITQNGKDYYKYADMGSNHKQPVKGDMMEVIISYSKMNDSLFWDSRDNGFPFAIYLPYDTLAAGGSYEKILLGGNEGDSINFIVPATDVFRNVLHLSLPYFLHNNDLMKVKTRVVSIMNEEQFAEKQKKIREFRKDMDMQEQLNLLQYVTVNNIPASSKQDNVYFLPLTDGSGPQVKDRSTVSIAYKGYFLNGHVFDSISPNAPLQFRLGDTAQVIAGLEIGIKKMREGEKAKIIIPSQLAFGENGSSMGIVPPYTSVIYEVTMLKVNDPGK
ncbi:MAG: FKBP-type peptidyl-prolyl cis-trans isomerase [Bacteroidia bacterium]